MAKDARIIERNRKLAEAAAQAAGATDVVYGENEAPPQVETAPVDDISVEPVIAFGLKKGECGWILQRYEIRGDKATLICETTDDHKQIVLEKLRRDATKYTYGELQ